MILDLKNFKSKAKEYMNYIHKIWKGEAIHLTIIKEILNRLTSSFFKKKQKESIKLFNTF